LTAAPPRRAEPLASHHDRDSFSCGVASLDDYLKRRAGQDQRRNLARIFVAPGNLPGQIAGYDSLSGFAVDLGEMPERHARRVGRYAVVPAVRIGRFAIDAKFQGQGLGVRLLGDALSRIAFHSETVGTHCVVVDAIDERAAAFYAKYGFIPFPSRPLRLFLPVDTIRNLV
jgi:GNAT superfamily N-acetyltransferase